MTTATDSTWNRRRRIATTFVVCAFGLVATSCADGGSTDSSGIEVAERTDGSEDAAAVGSFDDLEFGDSLEDLRHSGPLSQSQSLVIPGFRSVEWEDLIPPGFSSDQVLARYQSRLDAAVPGSPELDALYEEMNAEFDAGSVNPELDSEKIQLAGFVAPLTYDGDDIVEFLLVPYFGACIHVPPPPVNQTVMVTLAEGESLSLEESWGAVWVAGEVTTTTTTTDLATAGYSISGPAFGVYDTL